MMLQHKIDELTCLYQKETKNRKLIGIDWGTKRVGIAVSDTTGLIASPLQTILNKQNDPKKQHNMRCKKEIKAPISPEILKNHNLNKVAELITKEQPLAVIVGLPINMNGSLGFQAQNVMEFVEALSEKVEFPIFFWDERLSSSAIERLMISGDMSRGKREKTIDQSSAAFVLQGVLDYLNHSIKL